MMRPGELLGQVRDQATGIASGLRARLAPPAAPTLTLETMVLPNGEFVLVMSAVRDYDGVTPEMTDHLRSQIGAAAVLVFAQAVVVYQGQ